MKFQDIHEECHPKLGHALQQFNQMITSSHSTAVLSYKYSIWSSVERMIEPSLSEALGDGVLNAIAKDGFAKSARNDARKLEDAIRRVSRIFSGRIHGTLETLISFIHFCKNFHPHTYTARVGNKPGGMPIGRLAYRVGLDHFPFCELCENLCELEKLKAEGEKSNYPEGQRPSSRYCKKHRPGSKDYRRDHNHREAFHNKIRELGYALGHDIHTEEIEELKTLLEEQYFEEAFLNEVWAGNVSSEIIVKKDNELRRHIQNYPNSFSEFDQTIRFFAYRAVHPKKEKTRRKTLSSSKGGTLKNIREAMANGKNISEAAKEAGVSRQAAWKALKKAGDI